MVLIGWKLTFSIRKVFCSFELRFLEVSGVDECTGFRFLDGTGLSSGVSEITLKWFEVLKTSEKQNVEYFGYPHIIQSQAITVVDMF